MRLDLLQELQACHEQLAATPGAEPLDQGQYFHACGSPACSAGYATMLPGFRKAGLGSNSGNYPVFRYYYANTEAMEKILGISWGDADWLFGTRDRTHAQQAREIKRVIRRNRGEE